MSHIEQLVARQLECWELRRRLDEEYRQGAVNRRGEPAYGPCLLVSREEDSGGTRLAHQVGERLRWQVYDREIVEEIARIAQVREPWVATVDEQVRSRWADWMQTRHSAEHHLPWGEYLSHLREVILTLGHHGQVVIVGRGASFILPREGSLSLRVIAPLSIRARRRSATGDFSVPEARHQIEKTDAERRAFIRHAFAADPEELQHYDVIVNTGELTTDAALGIVLAALHEKLGVQPEPVPCTT